MWIVLYFLIILTSVFFLPNAKLDAFWFPKNVVFIVLGFSLIASSWMTNIPKTLTLKNRWLGVILIYLITSFVWFFFKPIMLFIPPNKPTFNIWNFLPTVNVILSFWLIQTLVEYTDYLNRWVSLAKVFCWLAFIFSIYAILQFFRLDQLFGNKIWLDDKYMITFLGNSMLSGNFLAILSPLCLMFKQLRYKIFYLSITIAIFMTTSMFSIAALIFGLLTYLFLTQKTKLVILVILLSLLAIVLLHNHKSPYLNNNYRFGTWREILLKCRENPLTGRGLGRFAIAGFRVSDRNVLCAHNEPIQILYDNGGIMIFLICGYLFGLFKKIFYVKKTMLVIGYFSGFISYLVICLGSFPLRIAPLALIGILLISSLESQIQKE